MRKAGATTLLWPSPRAAASFEPPSQANVLLFVDRFPLTTMLAVVLGVCGRG